MKKITYEVRFSNTNYSTMFFETEKQAMYKANQFASNRSYQTSCEVFKVVETTTKLRSFSAK